MGLFGFGSSYNKWKISYRNAVKNKHKAFLQLCRLENEGRVGGENHSAWSRDHQQWTETKDALAESKPKYFKKYQNEKNH